MWSYSTVQRTRIASRPFARKSGYNYYNGNNNFIESSTAYSRLFSSYGGDDRRGGRGGGNDRTGGKRGGWSRNNNDRNSNNNNNNNNNQGGGGGGRNTNNRGKPNYSDQFLKPAARGELKNHRSGIPRLTGRKGKGRGVRQGDNFISDIDELIGFDNDMMDDEESFGGQQQQRPQATKKTGTIDKGSKLEDLCPEDYQEVVEFAKLYHSLEHSQEKEDYYWNEIDYDVTDNTKKQKMLEKLKAEAITDADGKLVVEVDDETFAMFDDVGSHSESSNDGNPRQQQQQQQQNMFNAPPDFMMDTLGVKGFERPPNPKEYDVVRPLVLKGPSMNDFVQSMAEHPTKYGQLRYKSPHPESTREPVPDFPSNRRNPPLEFVEAHNRFVYVWGVPPLLSVDEQPSDLENPIHALELQKTAAALFDVLPESVYPASISSAFVGFSTHKDQRFAMEIGPVQKFVESPVKISKYTPSEGDKKSFDESEMDRVVVLENLPSGLTPSVLASTLFPSGTDAGDLVYGGLSPDDFVVLSPHTAVLRLETAEHAENAIKSTIVEQALKDFGKHTIRHSKARRELPYTGRHSGPGNKNLERELGSRLIVDGDMPSKNFYLSHASTVHLRNLDPTTTKQEISEFFQPFCAMPRDVVGSIEVVTCHKGLPTGRAYVGFDEIGEAEAAISKARETSGRITGLGHNNVIMKAVRDSRTIKRDNRSMRTEAELLDSLDNWEQYADPKDLEELYAHGISKEALEEQFRSIRYHNPTFSGLDQAIRSEALNPETDSGGMYKELVRTYVETLKECISTPENPGPIYESLFLPDEEFDTEIFDDEVLRQEELKKEREVP